MALSFTQTGSKHLYVTSYPGASAYPVSMAIWFNRQAAQYKEMLQIQEKDIISRRLTVRCTSTGQVTALCQNGGSFHAATTTGTSSTSEWHHACAVMTSSTNTAAFLDGGSKATDTAPTVTFPPGMDSVSIGAARDPTPDYAGDAYLAEAAIWDVALSDGEVAILALGYSPLLVRPQSLIAYYPIIGRIDPEIDLISGNSISQINGPITTIEHPAMIYPSESQPGLTIGAAPPAGAIMNQLQYLNLGADLYNGTLIG